MNYRLKKVEEFKTIEEKTGIYTIEREGISIYQMFRIDVLTGLGTIVAPKMYFTKEKLESFNREKTLKHGNNSKEKKNVAFILRGKYSDDGTDVLLDEFIEKEEKKGNNIHVISRNINTVVSLHKYKDYEEVDFIEFEKKKSDDIDLYLTEKEREIISLYEKELNEIGYDVSNVENRFLMHIKRVLSIKYAFTVYLKKRNITKLYLSVGYRMLPYIKIAQDLGVEVIEIQYANIIGNYHFAYSDKFKGISPDIYYAWNEVYARNINVYPKKMLVNKPRRFNIKKEKKEQILVVCQTKMFESFFELTMDLLKVTNKKIILRLSPYMTQKEYKLLKKLKSEKQIIFSTMEIEQDLLPLIAESKWVISGFSTSLVEAYEVGSIPISDQRIENAEEFEVFIENGYMKKFQVDKKIEEY